MNKGLLWIGLLCFYSIQGFAEERDAYYREHLVQAPLLNRPEKGSLAGEHGKTSWSASDLTKGSYSLPLGLKFPSDRGKMLYPLVPKYSPSSGISEWGMGISFDLSIRRFRVSGPLDFETDDFLSPWGHLRKGDDGAYYPVGLDPHIRVLFVKADEAKALLPDGTVFIFGGEQVIRAERGIYAWYLKEIISPKNEKMSFQYLDKTENYLYLKSIEYGGSGDQFQYQISLSYSDLELPFLDYRSTALQVLNKRISSIAIGIKSEQREYLERYQYEFEHEFIENSPAFYLKKLRKRFATGATEPEQTLKYYRIEEFLEKAKWIPNEKLDRFLANSGMGIFDEGTIVDLDSEGLSSLEIKFKKYQLMKHTESGFEAEDLGKAQKEYDPVCGINGRRSYMKLRGPHSRPEVFRLIWVAEKNLTRLIVCSREGDFKQNLNLPGNWALSENHRFVDLNQDGKPDLVKLQGKGYQVLENLSTEEEIKFAEKPRIYTLNGIYSDYSGEPKTAFFEDLNGDGIPDLVVKRSNSFDVWYGKGGFEFEKDPVRMYVYDRRGRIVEFTNDRNFHFLDLNGDGITDLLVTGKFYLETFFLTGKKFVGRAIPAFSEARLPKPRHDSIRPIIGDFLGTGNLQAMIGYSQKSHTLELDRPGIGLLQSIDDGKGNSLTFEYERAKPEKNIQNRPTILSKFKLKSSGKEAQTYHYQYSHSKTHPQNGTLLGFEAVAVRQRHNHSWSEFHINDLSPPLLVSSRETDPRTPGMNRVVGQEFESMLIQGLPYDRLTKHTSGFVSADGSKSAFQEKVYSKFYRGLCPSEVTEKNSNGVLYQKILYGGIPNLEEHLICFPSEVVWSGNHAQTGSDFNYRIGIDRDSFGNPLRIKSLSDEGRVIQEISYRDDFRIDSIRVPGKGTTAFHYDINYRLSAIHTPDGISTNAKYMSGSDLLAQLSTKHGEGDAKLGSFEESFGYDGLDRLSAIWNNLYSSSQASPLEAFRYQYATAQRPGRIEASQKLASSIGEVWRKAVMLSAGDGDEIGSGVSTGLGWLIRDLKRYLPKDHQTISYGSFLAGYSLDSLENESLFQGRNVLVNQLQTSMGFALSKTEVLQKDTINEVVYFPELTEGQVEISRIENGLFKQRARQNSGGTTTLHQDEDGRETGFRYDVLGRIVQVVLPQGELQEVRYDGQGRLAETSRTGLGRITYSYWPGTDLLQEKSYFGNDQKIKRQIQFEYDFAGRIKQKSQKSFEGETEPQVYHYFYDGRQPGAPTIGQNTPNQIGFLTAIRGPEYIRTIQYQPDGKISQTDLKLGKWKTLKQKWTYQADGSVKGTSYEIENGAESSAPQQVRRFEQIFDLDGLGRFSAIRMNQSGLANVKYNNFSEVDEVQFSNRDVIRFEYDDLTRSVSGYSLLRPKNASQVRWQLNPRGYIQNEVFQLGDLQTIKDYAYTASGMLAKESDQRISRNYSYDSSGLLTEWTTEKGQKVNLEAKTDSWNLSQAEPTSSLQSYPIDELGRVKAIPGAQLIYGASGRVERIERPGQAPISYSYDESGKRLLKKRGNQIVEAYWNEGVLSDEGLIRPLKINGVVTGVLVDDQFIPLSADMRGSIIQDEKGNLSLHSAYGEKNLSKTQYATTIDYASQGYDPDLRSYRMEQRDYDPVLKRFLTPDPFFLEQASECVGSPVECNLYSYAKGNPITFVDPNGEFALSSWIGAGIGGALAGPLGASLGAAIGGAVGAAAEGALIGAAAGALIGGTVSAASGKSFMAGAGSGLVGGAIGGFTGGLGVAAGVQALALAGYTGAEAAAFGGGFGGMAAGFASNYLTSIVTNSPASGASYLIAGGLGAAAGAMGGFLSAFESVQAEVAATIHDTNKALLGATLNEYESKVQSTIAPKVAPKPAVNLPKPVPKVLPRPMSDWPIIFRMPLKFDSIPISPNPMPNPLP